MPMKNIPRIITLFAGTGDGKSTTALKDKARKAYFEFDPGSYERAESGLRLQEGQVDIYRFHPPFDLDVFLDEGRLSTAMVGDSGKGAVQVIHKLYGWEELRREFRRQFALCLQDDTIRDIIFDTGDDLWTIEQNAFKQRKQDDVKMDAAQMNRLEYKECNADMLQYYMACKSKGKNLIVVCHMADEYSGGTATGKVKPAGWNDGPEKSDITVRLRRKNRAPSGTITKAGGAHMGLIDMEIDITEQYPLNIDTMVLLVNSATYLQSKDIDLDPDWDFEEIINQAKKELWKEENA